MLTIAILIIGTRRSRSRVSLDAIFIALWPVICSFSSFAFVNHNYLDCIWIVSFYFSFSFFFQKKKKRDASKACGETVKCMRHQQQIHLVKIVGMDVVARKARAGLISVKCTSSVSNWIFFIFHRWRLMIQFHSNWILFDHTHSLCARKAEKIPGDKSFSVLSSSLAVIGSKPLKWIRFDRACHGWACFVHSHTHHTPVASAQWNSQDETFLLQNSESFSESDSHVIFHSINFNGIQFFCVDQI